MLRRSLMCKTGPVSVLANSAWIAMAKQRQQGVDFQCSAVVYVVCCLAWPISACGAGCPMRTLQQLSPSPSPSLAPAPAPAQLVPPPLQFGFYDGTCPSLSGIVSTTIGAYLVNDPRTLAPLLRLFFHDCFVQGCDASLLLDSTDVNVAEKDEPTKNFSLRKFEIIDEIKRRVEEKCPDMVSCADILALAAVNAVAQAGGPDFSIELGRRDGLDSFARAAQTQMPNANLADVPSLLSTFQNVGLDVTDLVALSGGHTIGQSHCSSFSSRLSSSPNATLEDTVFLDQLINNCSNLSSTNISVDLDAGSAFQFDNEYFLNLVAKKGVLISDYTLMEDSVTKGLVELYAANQSAFFLQFATSMRRMGKINVLTGTQGQIRRNCSIRNDNQRNGDFNPIDINTCKAVLPMSSLCVAASAPVAALAPPQLLFRHSCILLLHTALLPTLLLLLAAVFNDFSVNL